MDEGRGNAVVLLTDDQRALLRSLGLPDELDGLEDEAWFEVGDRLEDEIQRHSSNEAFDGTNEYGERCRLILVAMAEGDEPPDQHRPSIGARTSPLVSN